MSPCKRELSLELSDSPPCKRKKNDDGEARNKRLPNHCPVPLAFTTAVHACIKISKISGNLKYRMLCECASFYYGLCPEPTPSEYQEIAKTICNKYPMLQDMDCTVY